MIETTAATRSVVIEREMPHPAEKVWRALTEGHLLEEWLMKNDFQPIAGHRFQFRTTPMPYWDGLVDGVVLTVEPHRQLSYSWTGGGVRTVVAWTLTPTVSGVLVRMEQSGFGADQEANYQGANYGWQRYFGTLEQVVARLA